MAIFNFRWPGSKGRDKQAPANARKAPAESVEAMRRRARHRLVGAAVLVLVGVVGFPLLFDTQPRPIPVDIPIDIPDRGKVQPLQAPAPAASPAVVAAVPEVPAAAPAASPRTPDASGLDAGEEIIAPVPRSEPRPAPPPPAPPAAPAHAPQATHAPTPAPARAEPPKPEPARAEPRPPARPDDAARARALLEGRPPATPQASAPASAAAQDARFIVQVGAFGEAEKAREVRAKLERAGLKTYAQEVQTKDGTRIRVRVGPFATRTDADKAAARIKGLDLPAAVLTL